MLRIYCIVVPEITVCDVPKNTVRHFPENTVFLIPVYKCQTRLNIADPNKNQVSNFFLKKQIQIFNVLLTDNCDSLSEMNRFFTGHKVLEVEHEYSNLKSKINYALLFSFVKIFE